MNICFLLTHVPNPRMNKRIAYLKEQHGVSVVCTRRKSQDIWEPFHTDVPHFIYDIDLPSAEHLLKRYLVSQKYRMVSMKKLEEIHPEVIYTEGLDSLLIAQEFKKRYNCKIIFEVADLRENYIEKPKTFLRKILTNMLLAAEKKAFKAVDRLVVTSPQFYDIHYKKLISGEKVLFLPNVPDLVPFQNYKKKTDGKFTVGFIGGIRYLQQMKLLVDAAEKADCNVLFAGAAVEKTDYDFITAYCKGKEFVTFSGKYKYDRDIATLYGSVDAVYSVYDASNPNVRIALPNKLYESVICGLPIITAKNTYLAQLSEEWGIGMSVECTSVKELTAVLERLKNDRTLYKSISENCKKIRNSSLLQGNLDQLLQF